MRMRGFGRAVRRMAGHFSSREMEEGEAFSLFGLVRAFTRAADIMARENHFLQADNVAGAVALLPEKNAVIEELVRLVDHARRNGIRRGNLPVTLRQAQGRFDDIAAQNRLLLQQALTAQEALTRLIRDSVVEGSRHGYGRTGEAGADTSRAALSLDDRA